MSFIGTRAISINKTEHKKTIKVFKDTPSVIWKVIIMLFLCYKFEYKYVRNASLEGKFKIVKVGYSIEWQVIK